jgi:hypothetical protein
VQLCGFTSVIGESLPVYYVNGLPQMIDAHLPFYPEVEKYLPKTVYHLRKTCSLGLGHVNKVAGTNLVMITIFLLN